MRRVRTSFAEVEGDLRKNIAPEAACPLVVQTMNDLRSAEACLEMEAAKSFDFGRAPLMRACVISLDDATHLLALTVHHLICDGSSIAILLRDFAQSYEAAASGKPVDLFRKRRSVTSRRRNRRPCAQLRQSEATLPYDRPRPARMTGRGASVHFDLGADVSRDVTEAARAFRLTPFLLTYVAFAAAIAFQSGADRIPISVPTANRASGDDDRIGCLIRTMDLDLDLSGDPTVQGAPFKSEQGAVGEPSVRQRRRPRRE